MTELPINQLLDAAQNYARRGWPVLPVHSPHHGSCTCDRDECDSVAKHPRTPKGLKDASKEEATINKWWETWPEANVGIQTGCDSDLIVIDVDAEKGGRQSLADLESQHGELPATVEAITGGGGCHILFQHPGAVIRNRVNLRPGIDIRGDGGYIVAAPSRHFRGGIYRWDEGRAPDEMDIAKAPKWLVDLITKPAKIDGNERNQHQYDESSELLLNAQRYVTKSSLACQGERNNATFNLAGHLAAFQTESRLQLTENQITNLMRSWNDRNRPPLPNDELIRTVSSALENGSARDSHIVHIQQSRGESDAPNARQQNTNRIKYQLITSADLDTSNYALDYLIEGVLVDQQPCLVAGPHKLLKTNMMIDLAISLAVGGRFLGYFQVTRPCRVGVMSGESGLPTIQETSRRIARAAGYQLSGIDNLSWSPDLPIFGNAKHMDALGRFLAEGALEVLILDPAYLCAIQAADKGHNLFAMGDLLRSVNDVCQKCGTTLLIAHHMRKTNLGYGPPELADAAWSDWAEWARQWLLVNRRQPFDPDSDGEHRLWLALGGSAGHSGLWGLDIIEGKRSDPDGRRWKWKSNLQRT